MERSANVVVSGGFGYERLGGQAALLQGLLEAGLANEGHVDARRAVDARARGALHFMRISHLLDQSARDVDRRDQRTRFGRHLVRAVMERDRLDDRERDAPQAK